MPFGRVSSILYGTRRRTRSPVWNPQEALEPFKKLWSPHGALLQVAFKSAVAIEEGLGYPEALQETS